MQRLILFAVFTKESANKFRYGIQPDAESLFKNQSYHPDENLFYLLSVILITIACLKQKPEKGEVKFINKQWRISY